MNAYRLSLLPYPVALVLAVGLGVAIYLRTPGPTVYRSTWCPRPEERTMPVTTLSKDQVMNRLREIRARLRRDDAGESRPLDQVDSIVDDMLLKLIADFDLATTPLMEAKP